MNSKITSYLLTETAIGIVINVLISIGFVLVQFHGMPAVPTSGPGGLIRDALPQTFAIALMSVLVPTVLTRKRGLSRVLPAPAFPRRFAPSHVLLRGLLVAVLAALLGLAVNYAVFHHAAPTLAFRAVLAFKAAYGGLVALIVSPIAVMLALHDVAMRARAQALADVYKGEGVMRRPAQ